MRLFLFLTAVFCFAFNLPQSANAEVRLFTGSLAVVTTSGKACATLKGNHSIALVIGSEAGLDPVFGYLGGDSVTVGQLRGASLDRLALRYPYPDVERAEGHTVNIEIHGDTLLGELRDRHLDSSVDDCNFDLARIKLVQSDNTAAALASYQRLSTQFEAQLARSTALALSRSGAQAEAGLQFEKALALADALYAPDSSRLIPYLTSLANSYMRGGRYSDFIRMYDARITGIKDDAARQIFHHHQIRSLLQVGRSALGREEYQSALDNFRRALLIDYKNKDAIAATMSALVRSGRHDEAIAFLEDTEQKLDQDPDRQDVREAIALVAYQKARKEQKAGRVAEAESSLRKAIKLDPGTAHYLVVLARWVHKAGNYSEADVILKRGIESFKDEQRRQELVEARAKLKQTEMILDKIRKAGT